MDRCLSAVIPFFQGRDIAFPTTLRTVSTYCLWKIFPLPAVITSKAGSLNPSNPLSPNYKAPPENISQV